MSDPMANQTVIQLLLFNRLVNQFLRINVIDGAAHAEVLDYISQSSIYFLEDEYVVNDAIRKAFAIAINSDEDLRVQAFLKAFHANRSRRLIVDRAMNNMRA